MPLIQLISFTAGAVLAAILLWVAVKCIRL